MFFRKHLVTMFMAGAASIAVPAWAQADAAGRQDVAAKEIGSVAATATQQGIDRDVNDSGGVRARYPYLFSKDHGTNGQVPKKRSYTWRNAGAGVKTDSDEVSAAHEFRMPFSKVVPFSFGVGSPMLDPKDFVTAKGQDHGAFNYGGGADFKVTQHMFIRAQYRGFVQNSPNSYTPAFASVDRTAVRAEPTIGIAFRF